MDVSVERHGKLIYLLAHHAPHAQWSVDGALSTRVEAGPKRVDVHVELDPDAMPGIVDGLGRLHLLLRDGLGRLITSHVTKPQGTTYVFTIRH